MDDGYLSSTSYDLKREFYIQIVDVESYIAIEEYYLGKFSVGEMANTLDCDMGLFGCGGNLSWEYDLSNKISPLFGIEADGNDIDIMMVSWSESDGLPYRTHAGRELILMKAGIKPLSVFTSMIPEPPDSIRMPEKLFSDLVKTGSVIKRSYCEKIESGGAFNGIEILMYSLPNEEWRINAYILLKSTARKMGWSKPLSRMEGSLLGYNEWQNDAFLESSSIAPT